ncbi:MAG TPA: hypothetical protein VK465_11550 [Fibrobacteria bacterium]|nr:hypothetical protein [Fibrobacteria bacterium]
MSRARRQARLEMGEAINFEDVLTVMTVLLLLRLIFMVPLVNLDKAKTVAARGDAFWERAALYVHAHPGDSASVAPYRGAFGLRGQAAIHSRAVATRKVAWIEAAASDSGMTVLRHDQSSGRFIAMNTQGSGHSLSFRHGTLLWSDAEKEWFVASDSLDYGTRAESKAMEKEYRAWTKQARGY